jgi:hypothetical protein
MCRVSKPGVPKTPEDSASQKPLKTHIRVRTGHPRLRSDSHEVRSTMLLDPWKNLRLARPWVDPVNPGSSRQALPHPTYLQTKVKPFNATANHFLPTWLQHRQHGISTSVKSRFLPPIPGWAVKTCHCTHHAGYCSAIDAPSRHKTTTVTSRISRA